MYLHVVKQCGRFICLASIIVGCFTFILCITKLFSISMLKRLLFHGCSSCGQSILAHQVLQLMKTTIHNTWSVYSPFPRPFLWVWYSCCCVRLLPIPCHRLRVLALPGAIFIASTGQYHFQKSMRQSDPTQLTEFLHRGNIVRIWIAKFSSPVQCRSLLLFFESCISWFRIVWATVLYLRILSNCRQQ